MTPNSDLPMLLQRYRDLLIGHPESRARINVALLNKIFGSDRNKQPQWPNSEIEKESMRRKIRLLHIATVANLIAAGLPDDLIIEALRDYFPEKKYGVSIFSRALFFLNHGLLSENSRQLFELGIQKNTAILERTATALIALKWDDDEIVALLLKIFKGHLIVMTLEKQAWTKSRIVKAFCDTKSSKQSMQLYLTESGWNDVEIIAALEANSWSTYNIVQEMSEWLRWEDARLLKALSDCDWSLDKILTALFSQKNWPGERILHAFIKSGTKIPEIGRIARFMLARTIIEEDDLTKILTEADFSPCRIEQTLTRARKHLLSMDQIKTELC
ncbi:MAG: hypothetical protein ACOZBH_01235 [Patescibacteria group bacterium]